MIGDTANREAVRVSPDRLAHGTWCHRRNRQIGEGDVAASYSADLIAMEGRVRRPFRLDGWLHVTVSMTTTASTLCAKAYRLMPIELFDGTPTTYHEKSFVNGGDTARADPLGFYHGMTVRQGRTTFALCGPPVTLVPGTPATQQMDLFADDA